MFLDAVFEGLALGLVVNPYSAAAAAVIAAVVWTRARTLRGRFWAVVALGLAWVFGDAMLRLAFARSMEAAGEQGAWFTFAISCAASLLGGYALPMWAGVFVGKRVIRGTGWISAGVVAASAAGAVFAIGTSLAERV